MNDSIMKSIRAFSDAFRAREPDEFSFSLFSMFPLCCCEFASLLLGRYLHEEHPEIKVNIVIGELKKNAEQRHIWLKFRGKNIDITAYQFDESLPAVLITSRGGWHDQYKIIRNTRFDNHFDVEYWCENKREIRADYMFLSSKARVSCPNNALN